MASSSSKDTSLETMSVPDFIMNKLLCSKCDHYLSVYPIHSLSDGTGICGRCINLENPEGIENKLYETLLESITFPCMNKKYGCMEIRTGNKMFEHETKCPLRRINCPTLLTTSCPWTDEVDNLLEHFENHHLANLMQEPSFEVNFVHNYDEICLLPYSDSLFLVKKHGNIDTKEFWCAVQTIFTNENEQFEYYITLKNPKIGKKIELPKQLAVSLDESRCTKIDINEIQKDLENPTTIIAAVDILEYVEKPPESTKDKSDYLTESNLEMLKIIECPVCFDYMVPPIYQCTGGHSICGDCKNKIQQCPTCQKSFGETQNYAVESFTSFLKYPCKNFERGCDFFSSAKEIRKHECLCIYGLYSCPTASYNSCNWSGKREDIWAHCKAQHVDSVMESSVISVPFDHEDIDIDEEDCFILKYLKDIFILHRKYNAETQFFFWIVQLIGPVEDCKKYYFDLDIIDRSGKNSRIFMRSACDSFTNKKLAFKDGKSFIFLTYDQVQPFINEVFCFKLLVSKYNSS